MKIVIETKVIFNRAEEAERIALFANENPGYLRKDGETETIFSKRLVQRASFVQNGKEDANCANCAALSQKVVDDFPMPYCPHNGIIYGRPEDSVCAGYGRRDA